VHSEPEPTVSSDDTAAAAESTSFSVDELSTKLRKSLTLDDQPQIEELLSVVNVEPAAETKLQFYSEDIASVENVADASVTFYDCENKSFNENVLPNAVAELTQPTEDQVICVQPEVQPQTETDDTRGTPEVVESMADNIGEQPRSPPITVTKGTYNLNWDELDENSDPFMPTKGLSNSPPKSSVVGPAGDGNPMGENDTSKLSRRLTNSPSAAAVGDHSPVKPTKERRSVNNNVPEPIAAVVESDLPEPIAAVVESHPRDSSEERSDAATTVPLVTDNNSPSKHNGELAEVVQDEMTSECSKTVE